MLYQVTIPSRHEVARHKIEKMMAAHFGGYTAIEGLGGWLDDDAVLIREHVVTYYAARMNDESYSCRLRDIAMVRDIAEVARLISGETAVFYGHTAGYFNLMRGGPDVVDTQDVA